MEHPDLWTKESTRLLAARARYLSSLEAIQEIAEFATEHETSLEERAKTSLKISAHGLEGISEDKQALAATALVELVKSLLGRMEVFTEATEGHTTNSDRNDESDQKYTTEIAPLFRKFEENLPKEVAPIDAIKEMLSFEKPRHRTNLLRASLLTAAISDFEVLFASIIKFFYRVRPEALRSQDASIPWSEIEQYSSIEDLKTHYIDERVSKLMWQGFDDWMKWIEQQLKIKYDDATLDADRTREVFQRRHVIVHNGSIVSRQYLAKTSSELSPPALGEELKVDSSYLIMALERLIVLGISLTHSAMRKLCRQDEHHEFTDQDILLTSFNLLQEQHWEAVERVSVIAVPQIKFDYQRHAVRVNGWIARKKHLGKEAIRREVLAWDVSALQPMFELARLVLLEDESAIDLAHQMLKSGHLDEESLSTWPLFEDIRDSVRADLQDDAVDI